MNDSVEPSGVVFPDLDGSRSTSAVGRAVVWAALAGVDPDGARAAAREDDWRKEYAGHFRRLVESGLPSRAAAEAIATAGLAEVHKSMHWSDTDGERSLSELPSLAALAENSLLHTETVIGRGEPVRELVLPVGGAQLQGAAVLGQLDQWASDGVLEPSAAAAVRTVVENPEWLRVPDQIVVCLGGGAEIGPMLPLLEWGATVAAADLHRSGVWEGLIGLAAGSAGTMLVPQRPGPASLAQRAGADLITELPQLIAWIETLGPRLVVGNSVYADGGANVAASAASDAIALRLRDRVDELTLAYLATPTDVFAVPASAVAASRQAHADRSALARASRATLGVLSRSRLLQLNYARADAPGIHDALVLQQGPNYALAKRIQRWRATDELASGRRVSMNVAPPTRTRSVVKNRALAAAYAGAHHFGVQVFEPATTRVLMAALLVHDLHADPPSWEHPWEAEADQAVHGGLWTTAYSPRSALGIAALAGLPASLFHQGMSGN